MHPHGCEVRGKEVEQGFSNHRLQPTEGHEIHLTGQDQNCISFYLWLPPLLFLKMNCLHSFLGPLHCAPGPTPSVCSGTSLSCVLFLSTRFSLTIGPFTRAHKLTATSFILTKQNQKIGALLDRTSYYSCLISRMREF